MLTAFYVVYNEVDFIEYSLRSIYRHADRIVIIEGAWGENATVNGKLRSTDGTIEAITKFMENEDPHKKVRLFFHNEVSQLAQRSKVFEYLDDCAQWLWVVDGDEVYEDVQALAVKFAADSLSAEDSNSPEVFRFDSLTFVNDFYTYTPIAFPRLFKIDKRHSLAHNYSFSSPNHIKRDGHVLGHCGYETQADIRFFHYSYCHSPERFLEKKRERTLLHGNFSWELRDGLVAKEGDGIEYKTYSGEHPEAMKGHPLLGVKKHKNVARKELIVYVEHSGIGNLVLTTPTLKALRKAKPDAHIELVSWNRSNRIVRGLDCVDLIHSIEHRGMPIHFQKKQIDHLIVAPNGAHAGVVDWLSRISNNVIKCQIPNGIWSQHESQYKLQAARKLGYRGPDPETEIPLFPYNLDNAEHVVNQLDLQQGFIAICAGYLKSDHWHMKHWGDENYAEVLDRINEDSGIPVVFLGDQSDRQHVTSIMEMTHNVNVHNLCGAFADIKDVAALLQRSYFSLGNDGGLQHIAAAVGTPTVTVFTFTNHVKNAPIAKPGVPAKLVMVPCGERLTCQHGNWQRCAERNCLNPPVDGVWEAIEQVIKVVKEVKPNDEGNRDSSQSR